MASCDLYPNIILKVYVFHFLSTISFLTDSFNATKTQYLCLNDKN